MTTLSDILWQVRMELERARMHPDAWQHADELDAASQAVRDAYESAQDQDWIRSI